MAPCTPLTKNLTSEGSVGNTDAGESAMTRVPDIAVVEFRAPPAPILPEIVPIRAIFYSLEINITPTVKMRVILGSN
jgi:hypothetical protein